MLVHHRVSNWVAACVAILGIAASPTGAAAGVMGVLVPAYFYPGAGGPGGVGDGWAAMTAAAGHIPVTAVFNPNSGPGSSADANYAAAMTSLENAGGKVVAYIPTGYAATPLATVEAEADTYISQYGSRIDGFFIDEMTNSNSASDLSYYHDLYTYLKGLNASYEIIGNPGAPTDPGYLAPATQGADVLVTYENNDQSQSYVKSPPSPWVISSPGTGFASIVYNQPSVTEMVKDVNTASSNNISFIYVTDQTTPNPYKQLPVYWNQEVAAIEAASVPEPATLALWSLGGLVGWGVQAAKKLRQRRKVAA